MNKKYFKSSAVFACGTNLLASMAMVLFLEPGLNTKYALADRMQRIISSSIVWRISWLTWIFAAIALIFFLIQWGYRLDQKTQNQDRPWVIFGVMIGCLGLIPDTIAEVLYMQFLPQLAEHALKEVGPEHFDIFSLRYQDWESTAQHLTGFLGNGFYCLGGAILQWVTLKNKLFSKFFRYFGVLVWMFGFLLSTSVFVNWSVGVNLFTALTMSFFVCWTFFIGILKSSEY